MIKAKRVFVYWNLHKKMFSVKSLETKKVIAHVNRIELFKTQFKVNDKGRERVRKTRRKNVHAGVEGWWLDIPSITKKEACEVRAHYNPYTVETFVDWLDNTPLTTAIHVLCEDGKVYANIDEPTIHRPKWVIAKRKTG